MGIDDPQFSDRVRTIGENFYSRGTAAEVLRAVAEAGSVGHWPREVSVEEFGRAIGRVLINAPTGDLESNLEIIKRFATGRHNPNL